MRLFYYVSLSSNIICFRIPNNNNRTLSRITYSIRRQFSAATDLQTQCRRRRQRNAKVSHLALPPPSPPNRLRLSIFGFSCGPSSTNLPLQPAFLFCQRENYEHANSDVNVTSTLIIVVVNAIFNARVFGLVASQ